VAPTSEQEKLQWQLRADRWTRVRAAVVDVCGMRKSREAAHRQTGAVVAWGRQGVGERGHGAHKQARRREHALQVALSLGLDQLL